MKEVLDARAKGKAKRINYVTHFEEDGDTVLQSARKLGLEGIVSKKLSAPYRSGRSENWTKAKGRDGQEVVLGGWKTTNGKFRSLMAGVYRGGHLAFVGIGRHGLWAGQGSAPDAGVEGCGFGQEPVRRQGCAGSKPAMCIG